MALRNYKPKHKKAPWTEAFPKQIKPIKPISIGDLRIIKAHVLRPVSKRRQATNKAYRERARAYVSGAVWTYCLVAAHVFNTCRRVTEIHHMRGRAGKLLMDERYWMAVSEKGHRWIHDNPEQARRFGWLCAKGEWGKQS